MPKSLKLLQDWIDKTIVGLNLCPFAKASLSSLHIEKSNFIESKVLTSKIIDISQLVQNEVYSNAIIYFDEEISFYELYKSSVDFEDVLKSIGYHIKVIAFHPDFVFEGLDFNDKANYVNRSPMPLLHLIPIKLIEKAKLDNMSAKNISINNENKIKELDESKLVEFFGYMNTDNK